MVDQPRPEPRSGGSNRTGFEFAERFDEVASRPAGLSAPWVRDRLRHGYLSLAGTAVRPSKTATVSCFYLHYVYDDQVEAFRSLLERLLALGPILTTGELLDVCRGQRALDGPAFHLSFDDGFDNVYRNAFPVLEDLGVHAAVFVPSGLIDAPDSLVHAVWTAERPSRKPTRHLSWSQLREIADAGHEVGSHTRHHVRLSGISDDPGRLEDEVAGSKHELEDRLGRPCRVIAWPYGSAAHIDPPARRTITDAGYEASFSAIRGRVAAGDGTFDVPRHHFEPQWPWSHVRYFAVGGGR